MVVNARATLAELAHSAEVETEADQDAELLERFRGGERRAFDELVKKYQRQVYYLALRYVKNGEDAKDVAQRAFVKAFVGIDRLRGDAAFRTWLYKIAVNLSLNLVRDRARLRPAEEAEEAQVDAVGDLRLEGAEDRRALLAALDELPPKQRTVLELRVFEELPFRDVAAAAGCTENAAKVNFHHAVTRLRQWMTGKRKDEKKP
jgi:RNA polymerase sigma-70 factor, ECF subfamily